MSSRAVRDSILESLLSVTCVAMTRTSAAPDAQHKFGSIPSLVCMSRARDHMCRSSNRRKDQSEEANRICSRCVRCHRLSAPAVERRPAGQSRGVPGCRRPRPPEARLAAARPGLLPILVLVSDLDDFPPRLVSLRISPLPVNTSVFEPSSHFSPSFLCSALAAPVCSFRRVSLRFNVS